MFIANNSIFKSIMQYFLARSIVLKKCYPMMNFETLCNVYNVCIVPWGYLGYREGVFSTVGDIMINMGDILSIMGVFSTVGIS